MKTLLIIASIISILIIFVWLLHYSHKRSKDETEIIECGYQAEKQVKKALSKFVKTYGGHLYNDIYLQDETGFSSNIDHIILNRAGLFIIETKGNKGIIRGNGNDKYWTCVKKSYQDDKIFRNPIKQNKAHIHTLKKMFGERCPYMNSLVIFTDANIMGIDSDQVFDINRAIKYLESTLTNTRHTVKSTERLNQRLNTIIQKYKISRKQHIKNIERTHKQKKYTSL